MTPRSSDDAGGSKSVCTESRCTSVVSPFPIGEPGSILAGCTVQAIILAALTLVEMYVHYRRWISFLRCDQGGGFCGLVSPVRRKRAHCKCTGRANPCYHNVYYTRLSTACYHNVTIQSMAYTQLPLSLSTFLLRR